jgi:hypothetical protein
MLYLAELLL